MPLAVPFVLPPCGAVVRLPPGWFAPLRPTRVPAGQAWLGGARAGRGGIRSGAHLHHPGAERAALVPVVVMTTLAAGPRARRVARGVVQQVRVGVVGHVGELLEAAAERPALTM